ncbi:hypothetical protein OCK74_07675 [Chitinophagaceae bacterium LB-8]|uniref:Beta-lactamase-inhibitor-like PepSY-like domain-containing protein n=1 Tax=Paraflavisolibacter caeni TaxID=2982496 RepID=A0A9X3B7X3_9BACT|nr:hypothetical protein [Paraflavisolibacter caeni]MCU7548991.1 hypothetical protein [Paraflavisolibacter caeni]
MKKAIIARLIGLSTLLVSTSCSFAQTAATLSSTNGIQKTKLANTLNSTKPNKESRALAINEVSSKAVRTFERYFKNVTNLQWFSIYKNKYLATFTTNEGRNARALIAQNGYIYYAISYGNEENLSKEQKNQIKFSYIDYTISKVSEVSIGSVKAWVINLEDKDNLVIVRLTQDGMLDELEHYQKQL